MESLLADAFADNVSEFVGLFIGFGLVVLIPLVYMFLHHQRKMAALLHQNPQPANQQNKIDGLESEVRELKERINHLILAQENGKVLHEPASPPSIPDRLKSMN